ncbi:helix-turn-helix transcriptional regulator [Rhizobium sp. 18055]|uniref:ArsR/SmtB family transcription factor n=1 Tax=Rhizobium sp. 18055 TaxID=2681403 RepID=UPI0013570DF5|nr:metalloregulator ArsR/SmtB family transcription factor [Rhizobium sp. 18055]
MLNADIAATHNAAALFAALGDPTRLSLLATLSDGHQRSITGLSGNSELTRQAITKHLNVLQQAGLVESTRVGRESHYRFRPDRIDTMRAYLDSVSRQWDDAIDRLRSFVER